MESGVCRLALVPVRKEPLDGSEQVTQLLFGDHYEVLHHSPDKRWMYIRVITDQSEGWIDTRQHHSITPEYLEQIGQADFKITTDITATLLYKKSPLTIVMGSIVPISTSELFKIEEQLAFNGETKSLGQRREFEYLKAIALKYINSPFQWGGKSPFGIDAGGFVQMVFKICGYTVPRNSVQQAGHGKAVTLAEARPGDIAYFSNAEGKVFHAGIILEADKIIHSSGRVRIDHINEEGILDVETKIYTHHLAGVRRVLGH
jgi:gamma-D-glutamyl-L-lysine dipeptidyl-peptidase